MRPQLLLRLSTVTMAVCLALAFSPATDSDTGWRNTVGDVVWTLMFLAFAGIVAGAIWTLIARRS